MKELTKKILEAGLVDKHVTKMMEDWGYLEPGSTELVAKQKLTKERLEKFVEDMEGLLSPEVLVKETVLDEPGGDEVVLITPFGEIGAIKESNGDFIINPFFTLNPGNVIQERNTRHQELEVLSVRPIYKDSVIFRKRVTVVPSH